ncbi:Fatty acid hydroxylase domain-containing protein 2 [Neolecta irregularis DAH-3]|uniref:Fatty acid hydroxylase domain-containing protein 2 n=1 Tax=Neolecta irregularis (strain DAH-3) TaxID=1198029 RepID=A0A1U7LGP7_NEOID|nr:Fatty acid hydroxylase domain-containing protein 2 [Neolecta irregularis DAH-3]|eukprot:OLL21819.1 Fatty acid hydroxylase domain-containing protein 2 [Neolecta irregularis DAH-3]
MITTISVIFYLRVMAGQRKFPYKWKGLPSFQEVALHLTISVIIRDILFYYGHVALHSRYLYKFIHKQHHAFTAPMGMSAMYCHPVEHLVSNFIPVIVGPGLLGSHILVVWLFVIMESVAAVSTHSGYHLPGILREASRFHDYHHEFFTGNYGSREWLDYLHGTDSAYKKYMLTKNAVRDDIVTEWSMLGALWAIALGNKFVG